MWKIASINNDTHAVSMLRDTGERLDLVIPVEQRVTATTKRLWINAQTDAKDVVLAAAKAVPGVKAARSYILYAIVGLNTLAIILMFLTRH